MARTLLTRLTLPWVTTAQRDALADVANGQFVYNTTTGTIQARQAGAWKDVPLDTIDLTTLPNASGVLDSDDKVVSIEDGNTVLATQNQLHPFLANVDFVNGFDFAGSGAQDMRITGDDGVLGSLILRGGSHATLPGPVRMASLITNVDPTVTPGAVMCAHSGLIGTDQFEMVSPVASAGNVCMRNRQGAGQTTSATPLDMTVITGAVVAVSTVFAVSVDVYARQTAGTGTIGHSAYFRMAALFERASGGTLRQVGATATQVTVRDNATWSAVFGLTGSNTIKVTVTGEASKTIRWHMTMQYGLITT